MQQIANSPAPVRLDGYEANPLATQLLPEELVKRFHVAPLWMEENELIIAAPDPFQRNMLHELSLASKFKIRALQASYGEISFLISHQYAKMPRTYPKLPLDLAAYTLGYLSEEKFKAFSTGHGESPAKQEDMLPNNDAQRIELLGLFTYRAHTHLDQVEPWNELSILIRAEDAKEFQAIPLWWIDGILMVGISEDNLTPNLKSLEKTIGIQVQPIICSKHDWNRIFRKLYLQGNLIPESFDRSAAHWLLERGLISQLHLETAEEINQQTLRSFASIFLSENLVAPGDWAEAVSSVTKKPLAAPLKLKTISSEEQTILTNAIPFVLARKLQSVPLRRENPTTLIVGMVSPESSHIRLLQKITGWSIKVQILDAAAFSEYVSVLYEHQANTRLAKTPRLGNCLLSLNLITRNQLNEALSQTQTSGLLVGEQLVRNGYLDESDLAQVLGMQNNLPSINLKFAAFNQALISSMPAELLVTNSILPIFSTDTELWVAIPDPQYLRGIAELEHEIGKRVWPVVAPRSVILAALDRLIGMKVNLQTDVSVTNLLEHLIKKGCITQVGATRVLGEYNRTETEFDKAVLKASVESPKVLYKAMAEGVQIPYLDIKIIEETMKVFNSLGQEVEKKMARDPIEASCARLIDQDLAKKLCALPVRFEGNQLVVVFADPLYQNNLAEIQAKTGKIIIPVLSERDEIEHAIQRNLGRKNLGTALLLAGIINRSELNDALDYAERTGVKLGRALLERSYITWEQLAEFLADQAGLPYIRLYPEDLEENIPQLIDPFAARKYGFLPFKREEDHLAVAIIDPLDTDAITAAQDTLKQALKFYLISPRDFDNLIQFSFRNEYLTHSTHDLMERMPDDSAFKVLSTRQTVGLVIMILLAVAWMIINIKNFLIVTNSLATLYYIIFSGYRLYLVYHALTQSLEIDVTKEDIARLDERDLPVYTLLVPVYKEAAVLPELLEALNRLDYPRTKLDIKILLEEDDKETIEVYNNWNAPAHFQGLVVPYGQPKTKPKACNYGLIHARGEFIVIFDAEDLPDPDQLKKNVIAFSKVSSDVVCIQNKLNYYNRGQNLLTGWFTIEYSMWFDLFLPGLDTTGAPVPLGGTSNHFRTNALVDVGAWDPHNVTEDADLGVRLYKRGYKTAIVDSTTYEEANSQFYNWIRQRSRWIKGYIQTWLVHMRHPVRLLEEMGWKGFLGFQFTVGGTFFSALMNPIYWLLTTLWFWREIPFIQAIFPGVVFYMGAACLFLGNFAFTYMFVAGALHRGYFELVKYALVSPLYWGLSSIAAWKGFLQLIRQPHFWEKTTHGLNQGHRNITDDINITPAS